jgi:hypothetical protein
VALPVGAEPGAPTMTELTDRRGRANNIHVDYSWLANPKEHWGCIVNFRTKRSAKSFLRKLEKLMRESNEDPPRKAGAR